MKHVTKATSKPRTYRVLYAVTRSEYYEIDALNRANAKARAFEEGELVDSETHDVQCCGVERG